MTSPTPTPAARSALDVCVHVTPVGARFVICEWPRAAHEHERLTPGSTKITDHRFEPPMPPTDLPDELWDPRRYG